MLSHLEFIFEINQVLLQFDLEYLLKNTTDEIIISVISSI